MNTYRKALPISLMIATLIHFLVFSLWPKMTSDVEVFSSKDLEIIKLQPEIEIPPPPLEIHRPATPVVADISIDEDITISPTTFEDNPVENLPPPPTESVKHDISKEPTFTPFTVRPELINREEIIRELKRRYPPILRNSGIGGTVEIWFFIDKTGNVLKAKIEKSSGYSSLDEAALRVANLYKFRPALNRDQKVEVWVKLPITFKIG